MRSSGGSLRIVRSSPTPRAGLSCSGSSDQGWSRRRRCRTCPRRSSRRTRRSRRWPRATAPVLAAAGGSAPDAEALRCDMSREPVGWDVDSPVQAEVFVVWLDGDRIQLTGPDGPRAWYLQLGATEHPVEVVDRIVRDVVGPPLLIHSTSWRRDRDAVILSFVVVIDREQVGSMTSVSIERAELARSTATAAPRAIASSAVVEHGLRHLAWLAKDDPVV